MLEESFHLRGGVADTTEDLSMRVMPITFVRDNVPMSQSMHQAPWTQFRSDIPGN
jgi:hypothetical protein